MIEPPAKRVTLSNITNKIDEERWKKFSSGHWFPLAPIVDVPDVPDLGPEFHVQNVHPTLALYKYDLVTETMSHDQLCTLLSPDRKCELLKVLMETGIRSNKQQCKFCGGCMSVKTRELLVLDLPAMS